jgi:hypothetical protein
LGIGPNPQSPIPNPQSPIPNPQYFFLINVKIFIDEIKNNNKLIDYNYLSTMKDIN